MHLQSAQGKKDWPLVFPAVPCGNLSIVTACWQAVSMLTLARSAQLSSVPPNSCALGNQAGS